MLGEAVDSVISPESSTEELLAAWWSADTLAVLAETTPGSTLLLTYEELSRDPRQTVDRLFAHLAEPVPPAARSAISKASETSRADSAIVRNQDPVSAWIHRVDQGTAEDILTVTRGFGLGFYGADPEPDLAALENAHRETTVVGIPPTSE